MAIIDVLTYTGPFPVSGLMSRSGGAVTLDDSVTDSKLANYRELVGLRNVRRVPKVESDATADAAQVATNTNDIASVVADQAVQDALIAAKVDNTQLAALQTQITANVDDSPTGFTREADGSITVSWETQADTVLPATSSVETDTLALNALTTHEATHDHTKLHDPLTLATGSAGTLNGQELNIPPVDISTDQNFAVDPLKVTDRATIKTELDNRMIDEDDFASDSETKSPTQQSTKAYSDLRRPILDGIGWVKPSGVVSEAGSKRIKIDSLSLVRWDEANNTTQAFNYAAADPISFRVADQNGYVATGLGGEDLTSAVDQIQQSWGYDNNGTLEDITAVAGDTNDGVNYRLYVIPQTGEFVILLPQEVVNTATNAFYRRADQAIALPAILNGAVFLGLFSLDEDAGNFSWSTSEGRFPGQTTSSNASFDQAYQYAVDPTTLAPADMTEGGVVGTGAGEKYTEYRVLTIGSDWASSTKQITWSIDALDLIFQRHPEPLPADGTLLFGRNYYGTDGDYTLANWTSNIVDGVEQNPRWLTLEQISSLNEDTKPRVTGKYKFSSTGQIFTGALTASANFRWNLYWVDSDPDPANHAWLIHSNRELVLPINSLDDIGLLLTRTNHYTAYNGTASDWVLRVPGGSPSGRITFRYDQNSSGPIKLESEDGDVSPHRLNLNGLVNWTQTIGVEHAGKLITLEANPQTDRWNIYIEAGAEDNRNLREWEPGDGSADVKYSAGEQVIVPMPINADWIADRNAEVGVNYVIKALNDRPNTVTEFNDVEADSGDWELIGVFRVSGNDFRTVTGTGTQALSFNDIGQTEAVSHTIPDGVTQSYLFSHSPSFITVFDDLIGTVDASRVDAANQVTFDVAGPATMKMTRTGNATQFTFASNEKGSGGFSADMLDIASGDHGFTFDAGNSDTTPTNTTKAIGGIGIRPVQANFTAAAQKQEWTITKDGDIAVYIPKHTVTPVTLQIGETATPANLFGVDIALDGTLSQPVAQPTNQLDGITATKFDNDEFWKIVIGGTRPTNVTLKVWGNDIGDGTDFEDIQYAFTIDPLSSEDVTTQSFIRRENVAAAGGEWVDLGGGLEIRAGGDGNIVSYPRLRVSDGVDKRIIAQSWYYTSDSTEALSIGALAERLAVGEEWNVKEASSYNLHAGYIQELIINEPGAGRVWKVEYTVQPDDASILLNVTYDTGRIFSTPDATTTKAEVTITINGGTNGTKQILEGAGAVSFILTNIPAGQVIDTATLEASALPAGVTAIVRDETVGTIAVEVDDGTGNVDIVVPFMADPGQQDADAGWEVRGDILECWGIATNGIVTLPNGLEYASNAYNVQAAVNVGSNGDHTNNVHFTAKAFKISATQFRLKAQSQSGAVTGNTAWPMSWRTIGKKA